MVGGCYSLRIAQGTFSAGPMRRREFITLIGGTAVVWPLASLAQKAPIVVGFLGSQAPPRSNSAEGGAIVEGFRDNGLIYGRDYVFEGRFHGRRR